MRGQEARGCACNVQHAADDLRGGRAGASWPKSRRITKNKNKRAFSVRENIPELRVTTVTRTKAFAKFLGSDILRIVRILSNTVPIRRVMIRYD